MLAWLVGGKSPKAWVHFDIQKMTKACLQVPNQSLKQVCKICPCRDRDPTQCELWLKKCHDQAWQSWNNILQSFRTGQTMNWDATMLSLCQCVLVVAVAVAAGVLQVTKFQLYRPCNIVSVFVRFRISSVWAPSPLCLPSCRSLLCVVVSMAESGSSRAPHTCARLPTNVPDLGCEWFVRSRVSG